MLGSPSLSQPNRVSQRNFSSDGVSTILSPSSSTPIIIDVVPAVLGRTPDIIPTVGMPSRRLTVVAVLPDNYEYFKPGQALADGRGDATTPQGLPGMVRVTTVRERLCFSSPTGG